LLNDDTPINQTKSINGNSKVDDNQQLDWLKANRDNYAGKYVALDGDILVAHTGKQKAKLIFLSSRFFPQKQLFRQVYKYVLST
jgi:hypothetical protein